MKKLCLCDIEHGLEVHVSKKLAKLRPYCFHHGDRLKIVCTDGDDYIVFCRQREIHIIEEFITHDERLFGLEVNLQ